MIRWLFKWVVRFGFGVVVLAICLAAPVVYTELACQSDVAPQDYVAQLPPEHHRAESRTLLTYPEWHIVHAYDDYAKVISDGDPHEYGFFRGVYGFWSSLCNLSKQAGQMGGVPTETKQMVYVIGVSFTAELAMKAAYEETVGRVFTLLRGEARAPLDDVSARQARDYAQFLQQIPWYRWAFNGSDAEIAAGASDGLRDSERALALGLEYRAKAAYAQMIEAAVASVGADALRLRMLVKGLPPQTLEELQDVTVVTTGSDIVELDTPRYRALTELLTDMAQSGADFVEIAGNDTIMFTAISARDSAPGAITSLPRQGYDDWRHLIVLPVSELADRLRNLEQEDLRLEHIHDY